MLDIPFIGLLNNTAILLALGVIYGFLFQQADNWTRKIGRGILLGLFAVGVMANPWQLAPGVFFDTRPILLSVGGMFLGPLSTAVAIVVAGAYRIYVGGAGAFTGTSWVVVSGVMGVGWIWLRKRPAYKLSAKEFYLFGLTVQVAMLLLMFTMPKGMIFPILQNITLPVLTIFPVGTVLLAKLLAVQELQRINQQALDLSERRLKGLVEVSPIPLAIVENRQELIYLNRKFTELFGYTREDLPDVDAWWLQAYPDKEYRGSIQQKWRAAVARSLEGGGNFEPQTAQVTCKDGTLREVVALFASIGEQDIVVFNDVTREREIDRMKSEFITTAAHEFGTPLASIRGFAELLQEHPFDREQMKDYLGIICEKTEILEKLVEDLLNLGHMETGNLVWLEKRDCDIRALVAAAVDSYQKEYLTRSIKLDWPQDHSLIIQVDSDKIRQVLENLLSNAVKFSPATKPILIRGWVEEDQIHVAVTDEGIGMKPDQTERVFERFYRADNSDTAVPGMGLGLAIAKGIVEAHGGRISANSEAGKGTTVVFSLPGMPSAQTPLG